MLWADLLLLRRLLLHDDAIGLDRARLLALEATGAPALEILANVEWRCPEIIPILPLSRRLLARTLHWRLHKLLSQTYNEFSADDDAMGQSDLVSCPAILCIKVILTLAYWFVLLAAAICL